MGVHDRRPIEPDWRTAAIPGRRLLFAVTRCLAGQPFGADGAEPAASTAVVARAGRRGRSLEVICVGAADVVGPLAPVAARFGAELVVRHVPTGDDPLVRKALREGAVVVAGSLTPARGAGLAHAPA